MIWLYLLTVVVAWLCLKDFGYPILYWIGAKRRGCGSLQKQWYWPLGIPQVSLIADAVKKDKLLATLASLELYARPTTPTFLRQSLFMWILVTRDPENIKTVLATKFNDYSLGTRNPQLGYVFGSGIFTQDGSQWKHSRAMLRPQFSKEQMRRLTSVAKHIDKLIRKVAEHGSDVVELQSYFHMLTMDTATEFLFGESVDSLDFGPHSKGAEVHDPRTGESVFSADFVESYTWMNHFAFKRVIMNELSWLAGFIYPGFKKHKYRAHMFIDHYVDKALQETRDAKPDDDTSDEYVFSYALARETRDPIVIRDQIFNILIAGRDTTASTLSFTVYYLAKYPQYWARIRDEVIEQMPNGDDDVTYESLRKLHTLQIFVKEVLRLAPVVPLNMRTAVRDTMLPRGGGKDGSEPVFVPKGMVINYSSYNMHRDPETYGPDASDFRPERWLPENKLPGSAMSAWGYIPFNGGPRICLGQQFALTEISLTISKLTRAFDTIEKGPGFPEAERPDRTFLTLMLGGSGLPVRIYNKHTRTA